MNPAGCLGAAMLLVSLALPAWADWARLRTPAEGPARIVGGYAAGCIAGATALPPDGNGYQAIRLSRSRVWGHPETVDFVRRLGESVAERGLGLAAIGDLGQARGGPMPWGHASHQTGLDVDVWFRLDLPPLPRERREDLDLPSMVDKAAARVERSRWTAAQAELVRLAAADPRVARIFVNPAIKAELCEWAGADREWLERVRPWPGHDAHFHVRLRCPAGSPDCIDQPPPPPGDGCGADLAAWFEPPPPRPKAAPPHRRPELPAACLPLLKNP